MLVRTEDESERYDNFWSALPKHPKFQTLAGEIGESNFLQIKEEEEKLVLLITFYDKVLDPFQVCI
jgi:hypothetical protein